MLERTLPFVLMSVFANSVVEANNGFDTNLRLDNRVPASVAICQTTVDGEPSIIDLRSMNVMESDKIVIDWEDGRCHFSGNSYALR